MKANQSERLRRSKEFEVAQNHLRANQIETMIAAFDRMCIDLGQQIEGEEKRARITDPTHFAYPTYAKAARERRANLQRSTDALKIDLDKLRLRRTKFPIGKLLPSFQSSVASIAAAIETPRGERAHASCGGLIVGDA